MLVYGILKVQQLSLTHRTKLVTAFLMVKLRLAIALLSLMKVPREVLECKKCFIRHHILRVDI